MLDFKIKKRGSCIVAALFPLVASVTPVVAEVCDKEFFWNTQQDGPWLSLLGSGTLWLAVLCVALGGIFSRLRFWRSTLTLSLLVLIAGLLSWSDLIASSIGDARVRDAAYAEGCRSMASDVTAIGLFVFSAVLLLYFGLRAKTD